MNDNIANQPALAELQQQMAQLRDENSRLQRENAELRLLTENASDVLSRHAPDGTFRYVSPAVQAVEGYTPADLLGRSVFELVHPDDLAALAESRAIVMETPDTSTTTYRVRHKAGHFIWLETTSRTLRDPATGEVTEILGVSRDITARRKAEEAARIYQETLRNLPIGMMILQLEQDADPTTLRVIGANAMAKRFTNVDIEAERGRLLIEIFPNAIESGLAQTYCDVAMSGEMVDLGDVPYSDERVGEGVFNVRAFPLPNRRVSVAFENVTERKRAEEVLRRALVQEEIIKAQEATLAELSTPLLTISEHVVAMPLIGVVDSRRAQQVLEALLEGVAEQRAQTVILDITGVSVVDTQVANSFLRAAQAVKLLGARVIITGIRPEVAQTLVGLGVDLGGIITRATLQDGINHALH